MKQELLEKYQNGDSTITLYADGAVYITNGLAGFYCTQREYKDLLELMVAYGKEKRIYGWRKLFRG